MSAPDIEATERVVLGSALMSTAAADDVTTTLVGTDYISARHGLIHDAIAALLADGKPHDALTVVDHLAAQGDLDRCGGYSYLAELVSTVATPASAPWHAERVREASTRRHVATLGIRLQQITERDGDPVEILDAARAELDGLAATQADTEVPTPAAIDAALASLDTPPGIATPWPDLTRALGGWQPHRMYVVAARPGIGKSVAGLEIALDTARRGRTAAFFSLEMSRDELWLRLLSNTASVDGQRIQTRTLREEDRQRLATAADTLRGLPLRIEAKPKLSLAQISSRLRTLRHETDLGMVVVDYLGLVAPPAGAPRNDRRVQVDAISRGLKAIAGEHRVPVVALAQINRASEARTDKSPQMHDLRESGGIEADADVVLLLHRELDPTKGDPSELDMRVAKNRSGPQPRIGLVMQAHYSRISDAQWSPSSILDRSAS